MELRQALARNGFVTIPAVPDWFEPEEFAELARLTDEDMLPVERVYLGDAGEPNVVDVGRIMTDVERPLIAKGEVPRRIVDLLCAPPRLERYSRLLGGAKPTLRRAQVNTMREGSYVGRHLDTDSNPDYELAFIVQLGTDYEGGDFVAHHSTGARRISTVVGTLTVSDCRVEHEVETVRAGRRKSLVYFISGKDGDNRRVRS